MWHNEHPAGSGEILVIYSFSQINQYLRCPRSYRYRYLDGWKERDTRASMIFGRCFETALGAYFRKEDSTTVFFKAWSVFQNASLEYSERESWDRFFRQGVDLLHKFAQHDRVRIRHPETDLQIKMVRALDGGNEFIAYIDAVGELDGKQCLIDWKTTSSRYTDEPSGLLSLDPQLVCYSWISGIPEVALVVFVRKNLPEIQYLRASISEERRGEFARLVQTTVNQIESGEFVSHAGIRFPQNACITCSHLGLCLDHQPLIHANLVRKPGASDLDWINELTE